MQEYDMLTHLADTPCPLTSDAKAACNKDGHGTDTALRHLAHKVFDQIQGAEDGSLVEEGHMNMKKRQLH